MGRDQTTVRFPGDLKEKVDEYAEDEYMSQNAAIVRAVKQMLDEEGYLDDD